VNLPRRPPRRLEDLSPEAQAWVHAVRTAASAKGLRLEGGRADLAIGLGCGLMFHARCKADGHPEVMPPYLEPLAELVGVTIAEVEAVGVA
jgi:hypothetical protein